MPDITIGYKIKGDSLELDSISTGMFNTLKRNDLNKDESLLIGDKTFDTIKNKLKGINKIKSVLFGKELSDNVETPSITNDVAPNDLSPEESVPTEQIVQEVPEDTNVREKPISPITLVEEGNETLDKKEQSPSLFNDSINLASNGLGYGIGAIGDTINSGVSTVSNGLTGVVNMEDNKKSNNDKKNDDIEPLHSRRVGGRKTKKNKGGKKFIKKTKRYINSKTHKNKQNIQNKTIKRLIN